EIFAFTNPVSAAGRNVSIGLGDRLGLASPGHIKAVRGKDVFPVLAQQSIRELNLTGRTYEDVLAAVVWAVLREGYKEGYGADGDHLKTADEINMALGCGFSMITLDCSDHISGGVEAMSPGDVKRYYMALDGNERKYWEDKYLGRQPGPVRGRKIHMDGERLARTVLTYGRAIGFAEDMYKNVLKGCGRSVDFEISIDETPSATAPHAHFLLASEFKDREVRVDSMAPRFCGEFQKGIGYRGSLGMFREELELHAGIADMFGYRLSIHSGSDKFSIFPALGPATGNRFHVKTAGTNWLEALRTVAVANPDLFRRMYSYAIEKLPEAKKYYHISTTADMAPDVAAFRDETLPGLLDIDESRQVLHVTYGYLLRGRDDSGNYIFRDEFLATMAGHADEYSKGLERHIGRHLSALGI
ncbi:MAG: hypothetical protein JXB33_04195, partial [Clostridia bacterium]|nr:hypothetical protein [Clostridia bacterium]